MSGNRYLLSAYGLAVKHGFTGTEEDFLRSLVGPQGPPGKTPEWDYYQTEREELDAAFPYHLRKGYEDLHKRINRIGAQYVYNLYDALDKNYVQMKELTDNEGNAVLREYVISCKTEGTYTDNPIYPAFKSDDPARKPKYLIVTGIHGTERNAVFSVYRFVRDMVNGHHVPRAFRDGAVLHVIPVADPTSFTAFKYHEGISVDKNFDWEWDTADPDYDEADWGEAAASKPETQAITKWLHENSDAAAFINCHNSAILNENVVIIAPADDETDRVKRAAMRGVDRIIPYWKNVIGYPNVEIPTTKWVKNPDYEAGSGLPKWKYETLTDQPVIFSYAVDGVTKASSVGYAINAVGIPSIFIEMLCYYGDFSSYWFYDAPGEYNAGYSKPSYQPEVIAMGAEAIGNILIELFSEASEVKDMAGMKDALDALIEKDVAQMQGKLDALMVQINSGFHAVRGSFTLGSDITPASGTTIEHNVACPNGAKIFVLEPADVDTVDKIKKKEDGNWTLWARVSFAGTSEEGCAGSLAVFQAPINAVNMGGQPASNTNGVTLTCFPLVKGNYNWTAYYWNEGEAIPAWTGGSY